MKHCYLKQKKWMLLALLLVVTGVPAQSAEQMSPASSSLNRPLQTKGMPLTLQTAIKLTMESNLELVIAKQEANAAQALIIQGRSRPNPEFVYAVEDLQSSNRSHSVAINLPIEIGGKRAARIVVAERGFDVALENLKAQRIELRAAASGAFFEALVAQESEALAQEVFELAKKMADTVAARVMAGKISPVEEIKARVAEANARIEWGRAQAESRNARIRLLGFLGANPPHFTLISHDLEMRPIVPSMDYIQQRLSDSSLLRVAQLSLEHRKALTDLERTKRSSDIALSLGVKRSAEPSRNQLLLGISVPLPLFDRNQGNLLEALARQDKAQNELYALKIRMETEVFQARELLASLLEEIHSLQNDVLLGSKRAYDAAIVGFEHGKFSYLEALDAQRTYFSAKSQYLTALSKAYRAEADIAKILGDDTPNNNLLTQ